MHLDPNLLIAALTILLGYTVLGLSGFGAALVAVPILAWQWPLSMVVPLVLLLDVPASLFHTGLNLRAVVWREVPRLLPGMLAGTLLGLWIHHWAEGAETLPWLTLALGCYVASVGLRGLLQWSNTQPVRRGLAHGAGVLIGTVEAIFGTAGPLVVAWLSRRIGDPHALRASIPLVIALAAAGVIAANAIAPTRSAQLPWRTAVTLLPLAFLGVVAGHRLARLLPKARLQQVVFSTLLVSGCAMTARSGVLLLG